MKPGDRVVVDRKRHSGDAQDDDQLIVSNVAGTVVAVHEAGKLYRRKPRYSPTYKGARKVSKYDAGEQIVQVKLDGEEKARNFPSDEVRLA